MPEESTTRELAERSRTWIVACASYTDTDQARAAAERLTEERG